MIEILGEHYSDIDSFINGFIKKDFMFKYDGLRDENQYTVVGRSDIDTYEWQGPGDTGKPFEDSISLFERLEIVYYEEYLRFLKNIIPYLINEYGDESIISIINRHQEIRVIVLNNRNTILDFQGKIEALAKLLNNEKAETSSLKKQGLFSKLFKR